MKGCAGQVKFFLSPFWKGLGIFKPEAEVLEAKGPGMKPRSHLLWRGAQEVGRRGPELGWTSCAPQPPTAMARPGHWHKNQHKAGLKPV